MAYHGYIPFIKKTILDLENPKILEVGLDKGMTTVPLVVFLTRTRESYEFVGIDILFQEHLKIIFQNIEIGKQQKIKFYEDSSLNVIPKLVEKSEVFDIVLLDGDHNYYTVSKELEYLENLVSEKGIVIIDDYNGRWANKDLWYSEREGYENSTSATKRIETEKHGVKSAVDEFLERNLNWESFDLMSGEPVILRRKQNKA